jgi:hypothetical protein
MHFGLRGRWSDGDRRSRRASGGKRIAAAHAAGLPTASAARLRGETEEELAADAAEFAAGVKQIGTHHDEDFDVEDWMRRQQTGRQPAAGDGD